MTWRTFFMNVALTIIMAVCFVLASYLGMMAAIDHIDELEGKTKIVREK